MNLTEMLTWEAKATYHAAKELIGMIDDSQLDWKPETGSNWMTTGQLARHIATACGSFCKGLLTDDWSDLSSDGDDLMPPAEKMPSVGSKQEALDALAADRKVCLQMLEQAGEENLRDQMVAAPWDPIELPLGQQFLHSIQHLNQHKGQLYYYLKLQGEEVNTANLWGMV